MESVPTTPVHTPATTVFNDNNRAVFLSKESGVNTRSKHIDVRHHFFGDLVKDGIITPAMIDTKEIPADYLTKPANSVVLERCRLLVGNISLRELEASAKDR